ncbi:MAG: ribonuclease III [Calditrichota bacterium]
MEFLRRLIKGWTGSPTGSEELLNNKDGMPSEEKVIETFQDKFGILFTDTSLILTALKHRSYLNATNEKRIKSNERLEFLGDAVLDLVVTEFLYQTFPGKSEGQLSKSKSVLVSKPVIADKANLMNLGELVLMNRGEEKTGGRKRKSIIADAFEAIIGAIYLDQGLEAAANFIHSYLLDDHARILEKGMYRNYKSILLEYAQGEGYSLPNYRVIGETGPDHAKQFVIEVWVNNEAMGRGEGKSKKRAEQDAAREAVEKLNIGVG